MVILLLIFLFNEEVGYINKQDLNGVRTAQDIERKYDLKSIAGLKKNIEIQLQGLTKVENELNSILTSLLINLKDLLDTQDEISLWFYEGEPNYESEPFLSWNNIEEHLGDLYYDQLSGYVYQFLDNTWQKKDDLSLVQAMALTNIEIDTIDDHERKVYFNQPIPPYTSGDWWIKEDGTLFICQLGKTEGLYEDNDFMNSNNYTTTIAVKDNNTITVLKGTVTEITENYVKYTDLSTGGSTIIAGENITTGSIMSENYKENTSGTKINLEDGTIDTKSCKVDKEGNIRLYNGAKIIGENGLMTTYMQEAKPREAGNTVNIVGYYSDYSSYSDMKQKLYINILIPEGFEISKAKVIGYHTPIKWNGTDITPTWGYVRNLKIYKALNIDNALVSENIDSGFLMSDNYTYKEVVEAFDSNGWTATKPNDVSHATEKFETSDIKNIFQQNGKIIPGLYQIIIESSESIGKSWTKAQKLERTAYLPSVMLIIEGYMTYK